MEKIQLSKNDFLKALEAGGTFAGRTRTLPILECVKIRVNPSSVCITSGDNENWISKKIEVETGISEEVSFCVNFKDLYSYVKLVTGDMLVMDLDDNGMLTVKHKKGKTSMPTFKAEEYPQISAKDDYAKVTVPSYLINNWIMDSKSFVMENELRPILGSLYFYCEDGELGCCATDGSSMYWNHSNQDCENFDFTLNRGAFDAVCKLCSGCDDVDIEIGNSKVKFKGGDTHVLARRVEGKYPNFKMVIPKNNSISVDVDKKELIEAVNRCRLSADVKSPVARLSVKGMEMQICCENLNFGKSSVETILVDTNGSITIGLDCNFLLELLKTVVTERVEMRFSEPKRAMIMREGNDSNKLLLQMPMQIREQN